MDGSPVTSQRRVILDTDIGSDVDDLLALALIFGTPQIDLIAVTTVYGDTVLRAQIAKRVARLGCREVHVEAGEEQPLSGRDVWWAGHEGVLYPDIETEVIDGRDAVGFLVDTALAEPGTIDVVAIGPLTNIARAIQRDARFTGAVRHLWVMGGAFAAEEPEHNLRSDAAAAEVVFGSGLPVTVVGLDVTRRVRIDAGAVARMAAPGTAFGSVVAAEVRQWWDLWTTTFNVPHDPVAVLAMTDPQFFTLSAHGSITVDTQGEVLGVSRFTEGHGTARVVRDLDVNAVTDAIIDRIAAAGRASAAQT